jgi:CubicO group peptidase (beta-lactamase class C family)
MAETLSTFPGDDWETADPQALGLNAGKLAAAGEMLAPAGWGLARSGSNTIAFLVVRRGKIVWERYYQGTRNRDRTHLFSVTKSVLSSLVGIALQEGLLKNVDQPLLDYFPEIHPEPANPLGLLTLRHLLAMASGFFWPRKGWHEVMVERLRRSPDWVQFILGLPVRREEIGKFHYCSIASHLLSAVLTRATGQSACAYAGQRLFAPLGIAEVVPGSGWEADPQGITLGGWGLHLSAREIARFGWLYVSGGRWNGHVLVPEAWVQQSTQPASQASRGYGYQWWLRSVGGQRIFAGLGVGGQYLFCIPEQQMVVVILSRFSSRWPDRWKVVEGLLAQR